MNYKIYLNKEKLYSTPSMKHELNVTKNEQNTILDTSLVSTEKINRNYYSEQNITSEDLTNFNLKDKELYQDANKSYQDAYKANTCNDNIDVQINSKVNSCLDNIDVEMNSKVNIYNDNILVNGIDTFYKFIVIEGLDCSGKSTISKLLQKRLSPCSIIGFPDRKTETGKIIDKFLRKEIQLEARELNLLFSANRYEKIQDIKDILKHSNLISDRYYLSGNIYSAAKGLEYDWCRMIDSYLPIPDYTFFLDVTAEEASKRRNFGVEAHDKIDFQKKVYNLYLEKARDENLIFIDGKQTPEEMVETILGHLK